MDFVTTSITTDLVIMMVEIAVVNFPINAIAWSAYVKVGLKWYNLYKIVIFYSTNFVFSILDFTCAKDVDCNQGYCEKELQKCVCLDGFAYKEDCSLAGCEYDLRNH